MKKRLLCLLCAALLLLSSCGRRGGTQLTIYRVVSPHYRTSGELVQAEEYAAPPEVNLISSAIGAFNSDAEDQHLASPLPAGGRILGYSMRGGELRLQTEGCEDLRGLPLTLLRCCAALSFCSIDGVLSVSIYSGDTELCPPLSPADISLSDLTEE